MSKSKLDPNVNQQQQQQQQQQQVFASKRVVDISGKEFDAMTIGECEYEYDYETILVKILDEKKLDLARSPEVIRFLREFKHQNPSASSSHCRRVIL